MIPPLQRGDFVVITAEGRDVDAMVTDASPNGRSLILMFDSIIGSYAAIMPVLEEDGRWTAIIDKMPIEIARKQVR